MHWGRLGIALFLVILLGCSEGDAAGDGDRGDSAGRDSPSGDGDGDGDEPGDGDGDGDGFGNTGAESPNLPAFDGGFRDAASGAPDEEGDCGGIEVEPEIMMEVIPGNLLFVFDKSGSMCDPWAGGMGDKWENAHMAISAALTPLQDNVRAAAIFFPDTPSGGGNCTVPAFDVAPQIQFMDGPDFLAAWSGYWSTANCGNDAVDGATPLLNALNVADAALLQAPMDGVTNIVVITDGAPNCSGGDSNSDEPLGNLTPVITNWANAGYLTHVVGLPGVLTETTLLDGLAAAGGTTQHIPASDAMTLQDELAKIIGESVSTNFDSCSIGLPNRPPNLDDVNLTVVENGQQQAVARDLGTGGGWTITPDGTTIILQGLFCDLAQEGEYDQIAVVFGCVDLPPLPPPRPE